MLLFVNMVAARIMEQLEGEEGEEEG